MAKTQSRMAPVKFAAAGKQAPARLNPTAAQKSELIQEKT
jgi:hypothetical protein